MISSHSGAPQSVDDGNCATTLSPTPTPDQHTKPEVITTTNDNTQSGRPGQVINGVPNDDVEKLTQTAVPEDSDDGQQSSKNTAEDGEDDVAVELSELPTEVTSVSPSLQQDSSDHTSRFPSLKPTMKRQSSLAEERTYRRKDGRKIR